ncbi:microsomal glutathione S-transferase 1 [Nomia melanderi]|uniref:microsomal glutathione S-transferase 1 n=1 Tax=Nomia melanderi TaxID=2448451 RepID=UPI0013044CD6|nr:microsomal glutathione S-transferase 1-like [Nomia melanderi]
MPTTNMLALDLELFKLFGFWGGILVLKTIGVTLLTVNQRFKKRIFLNQDDCNLAGGGKVTNDPDIERVRRAHLNDLENIPLWFICTCLWLTTGPSTWLAGNLIKAFVLVRIGHTFVYAIYPKQPFRAIFFGVGLSITIYQAVSTILYYS